MSGGLFESIGNQIIQKISQHELLKARNACLLFIVFGTILFFSNGGRKKSNENYSDWRKRAATSNSVNADNDRTLWVNLIVRIADPVLMALSEKKLRQVKLVENAQCGEHYARDVRQPKSSADCSPAWGTGLS